MERWALIADVHGNAAALDAVVADLEGIAVDGCVLMGDYALFGPRPRECCDRLREMAAQGAVAILGNTDRYVHEDPPKHPASELIGWTREQVGEESVAWLGSRPFDHRIEAPGGGAGSVLVVHATPTDVEGIWDDRTPEEGARRLLGDARADWILYGHIHVAREGRVGDQRVRSIGSVGFPFDGDGGATHATAGLIHVTGSIAKSNVQLNVTFGANQFDLNSGISLIPGAWDPGWTSVWMNSSNSVVASSISSSIWLAMELKKL